MSKLNWSSPVRQSNGATLSPVPNEIYHEIFAYIRPLPTEDLNDYPLAKRELCNLALVCRFFSASVLPWIFESICFDSKSGDRTAPPSRSENSFCRSILRGNRTARAMAQYVKKCEFMSWTLNNQNEWICAEFLALYVDALAYMPNIQELTLTRTDISKGLLKAIGRMQNLSSLKVYRSNIAANVKHKHLKYLSLPKLRYCHFRPAVSEEELVRSINLNTVLHLTITDMCIPSLFSRSHSVIPLEKLDVFQLNDVSELEALLSRAPALKSLRISQYEPGDLDLSRIKQTSGSLPLLSTIVAPMSLVKFFAYKRPLSSITITKYSNPNEHVVSSSSRDFEALLKNTQPIYHLGIPIDNRGDVAFWQHLPDLQSLEFNSWHSKQCWRDGLDLIIKEITSVWPRLPKLLSLKFKGWGQKPYSLQQQHQWISEILAPHFPAMRCCSFFEPVQWHYLESSISWIPEIAPRYCLDLCSLGIDSERLASLDYAGCYNRILSFKEAIDPIEFDRMLSRHRRRTFHI